MKLAFLQSAAVPSAPGSWYWSLHQLNDEPFANSTAWVEGGPGNLVSGGGPLTFNCDGSLGDNGAGGADIMVSMPLSCGAASPFVFYINFGTDNVAGGGSGLRDGLSGDACCPNPEPTPDIMQNIPLGGIAVGGGSAPRVVSVTGAVGSGHNTNPLSDYGPAGAPNGFQPYYTAEFVLQDSLSRSFLMRLSITEAAGPPFKYFYWLINDVTGGQAPNSSAWADGGPGNKVASGGPLIFYDDGSLMSNGAAGPYIPVNLPVANGACSPLTFLLFLGTDDAANAPAQGLTDGLAFRLWGPDWDSWPFQSACAQPLTVNAQQFPPDYSTAYIGGNLDPMTPANPIDGYGPAGAPNGFVPDNSILLPLKDSMNAQHDFLVAFWALSPTPGAASRWKFSLHEVTGAQAPNSTPWSASGPGNLVGGSNLPGVHFNFDGSLKYNAAPVVGTDYVFGPLTFTSTAYLSLQLDLGTDDNANGSGYGLRDGLVSDPCGLTYTFTPSYTVSATASPTPTPTMTFSSPTATPIATTTRTPSASASPSFYATPSQTPILTSTQTLSPTPCLSCATASSSAPPISVGAIAYPNPSAPGPGSPVAIFAANPGLALGSTLNAAIYSSAGSLVAALSCVVCSGPTLKYEWDGMAGGSPAANGLYYFMVDLGPLGKKFTAIYVLQ